MSVRVQVGWKWGVVIVIPPVNIPSSLFGKRIFGKRLFGKRLFP